VIVASVRVVGAAAERRLRMRVGQLRRLQSLNDLTVGPLRARPTTAGHRRRPVKKQAGAGPGSDVGVAAATTVAASFSQTLFRSRREGLLSRGKRVTFAAPREAETLSRTVPRRGSHRMGGLRGLNTRSTVVPWLGVGGGHITMRTVWGPHNRGPTTQPWSSRSLPSW